MTPNNLLTDPIFTVVTTSGRQEMSLCAILEGLGNASVEGFAYLQPHQQQPWFCLLVQLATLCRDLGLAASSRLSASEWATALVALSGGEESAWMFVVEDLSRPAFLQPPVPEGNLDGFKSDIKTPDQLDIMVTAKNHEVKMSRVTKPRLEHWVYALTSLQTLQGYSGPNNYGIARMNGGHGSRPLFSIEPGLSWSDRFHHDADTLLAVRPSITDTFGYERDPNHSVLWTEPWSGTAADAVPIARCHPYAIEVCRRIRFHPDGRCFRNTTSAARIAISKERKGVTGDPWSPIVLGKQAKVLSVGKHGFRYDNIHDILMGDYENPAAGDPLSLPAGTSGWLFAQCFARGKGGTEGYHQRALPIPSTALSLFRRPDGLSMLASRSRAWIDDAGLARVKVLYPALRQLLTAGKGGQVDGDKLKTWGASFDRTVDAEFFSKLWGSVEVPEEEARAAWRQWLFDTATAIFVDAVKSIPYPQTRRFRARCAGERVLYGMAKKQLQIQFKQQETSNG